MRGLRDDEEVRAAVGDGNRFGGFAAVRDAGVGFSMGELRGGRLGRDDGIEVRGQRDRGLAVAGRNVDG